MENRYKVIIETEERFITIYTKAISEKAVIRKAIMKSGISYFDIHKLTVARG